MYKLGVMMKDKASGLKGCLVNMQVCGSGSVRNVFYNFQPAKLNEETGAPADLSWITADRVDGEECPDPELPLDALGTEAQDIITGFKGMVVALRLYMNGCVHLNILPSGSEPKTGKMMSEHNFDIRRLRGSKIPKLDEAGLIRSRKEKPSPEAFVPARPCAW